MQLILGWPPESTFDRDIAMKVMNLCADMLHRNMLGEVVAALPPAHAAADRARLFALATSLRRADTPPLALLGSMRSLTADDLDECLSMGISNFVFLDDAPSPLDAIATVSASRLAQASRTRVRLWLGDNCAGNFQRHLAAWISAFPFSTEVAFAPFSPTPDVSAPAPVAVQPNEQAAPAHCEWLRSVFTVNGSGRIVPCHAHVSSGKDVPLETLQGVATTHAAWMQSLGASGPCRACARQVRFDTTRWSEPNLAAYRSAPPELTYRDHVECDAAGLPEPDLARLVDEFAARIVASGNGIQVR